MKRLLMAPILLTVAPVVSAAESHLHSPGGGNAQLQFNDDGALSGIPGLTYDKQDKQLTFSLDRVVLDSDADGNPDVAYVHDWDGNGVLEMKDIQAAIDALSDSAGRHVIVTAGDYREPSEDVPGTGILILSSNTTLECMSGAVLNGFGMSSPGTKAAVVAQNASRVAIIGCNIDGNMTDGGDFSGEGAYARMGIFFNNVNGGVVRDSFVHHTRHACIYEKNSSGLLFQGNQLAYCGGYGDTTPSSLYPGIYMFADGPTAVTENVSIVGNYMENVGSQGIRTRKSHASGTVRGITASGNLIADVWLTRPGCISVNGAYDSVFYDTHCINATGFNLSGAADYWDGAGATAESSRNIVVDGLTVTGGDAFILDVGAYVDGVTIRDVVGHDSTEECIRLTAPIRNMRMENVRVSRCGKSGMQLLRSGSANFGDHQDEELAIRNLEIEDPTGTGILVPSAGLNYVKMEDVRIRSAGGAGMDFVQEVTNATFRNIEVIGDASHPCIRFRHGATGGVTFDGATVRGCHGSYGIQFDQGAEDLTFSNVYADGSTSTMQGAIRVNASDGVEMSQIRCNQVGSKCVSARGATNVNYLSVDGKTNDGVTKVDTSLSQNFLFHWTPWGPGDDGVAVPSSVIQAQEFYLPVAIRFDTIQVRMKTPVPSEATACSVAVYGNADEYGTATLLGAAEGAGVAEQLKSAGLGNLALTTPGTGAVTIQPGTYYFGIVCNETSGALANETQLGDPVLDSDVFPAKTGISVTPGSVPGTIDLTGPFDTYSPGIWFALESSFGGEKTDEVEGTGSSRDRAGVDRVDGPRPYSGVSAEGNVRWAAQPQGNARTSPPVARNVMADVGANQVIVDAYGNVYGRSSRPMARDLAGLVRVTEAVETGDVLVISAEIPGSLAPCSVGADPKVFGIVAAEPGVLLGSDPPASGIDSANRAEGAWRDALSAPGTGAETSPRVGVPVTLSGIALCKVDAGYGAIQIGDLLTTSPTSGHAMRSHEAEPGTILGKALEPLETGTGLIKVLAMTR